MEAASKALVTGVREGRAEAVPALLQALAQEAAAEEEGEQRAAHARALALNVAAAVGSIDVLLALLDGAGGNEAAATVLPGGMCALTSACAQGRLEWAEALLDHGADALVSQPCELLEAVTPLELALDLPSGGEQLVALLRRHGAVEADLPEHFEAVEEAAARSNEALTATLAKTGASVDAVDRRGRTALARAAKRGHLEAVEALLAAGADVLAADGKTWTPAAHATAGNHVAVLRVLLQVEVQDTEAKDTNRYLALTAAAARGHVEPVRVLISPAVGGSRLATMVGSDGLSALMLAAKNGHVEVVQMLLDGGAAEAVNDCSFLEGNPTALSLAENAGHDKVAELLRAHGALNQEQLDQQEREHGQGADSENPIVKQGLLKKRGGFLFRSWQERTIALRSDGMLERWCGEDKKTLGLAIRYFQVGDKADIFKVVVISEGTESGGDDDPYRTLEFRASSGVDVAEWFEALGEATGEAPSCF